MSKKELATEFVSKLSNSARGQSHREYSSEQDCKRKGMPVMECPNCNADFYYSGEKKTEEGSYWIDEDEPFPF